MDIFKAYKITRKYGYSTGAGECIEQHTTSPKIIKEIQYIKNLFHNKVKHYVLGIYDEDEMENVLYKRINKRDYNNIKEEEKEEYNVKVKRIDGEMCLCSIGLISKDEFNEAEDMMENFEKVRKKDLIIDEIYVGLNKKEYIYIGEDKLRAVKSGKIVKVNSQNLIPLDSLWNEFL